MFLPSRRNVSKAKPMRPRHNLGGLYRPVEIHCRNNRKVVGLKIAYLLEVTTWVHEQSKERRTPECCRRRPFTTNSRSKPVSRIRHARKQTWKLELMANTKQDLHGTRPYRGGLE